VILDGFARHAIAVGQIRLIVQPAPQPGKIHYWLSRQIRRRGAVRLRHNTAHAERRIDEVRKLPGATSPQTPAAEALCGMEIAGPRPQSAQAGRLKGACLATRRRLAQSPGFSVNRSGPVDVDPHRGRRSNLPPS
jgi:hypothetical protein